MLATKKTLACQTRHNLFLAEGGRTLIFDLLIESVTVTHGGDVVAVPPTVASSEAKTQSHRNVEDDLSSEHLYARQ